MKIAVVGSNRGIGLEITKQMIDEGHEVFAFCRKTSNELSDLQTAATVENFEVTELEGMKSSLSELNVSSFDWLIHVSGILRSTSLENLNEDEIIEQFKVNSLGPLLTTKAFLPYLKDSSKVGLLTSRMGSVADNTSGGSYGYRMSKSALNIAGKSLSEDLRAQGVVVLLLHPGYVRTDMTGGHGLIDADESAKGLIQIMKDKTLDQTGTFWHTNGEGLPW